VGQRWGYAQISFGEKWKKVEIKSWRRCILWPKNWHQSIGCTWTQAPMRNNPTGFPTTNPVRPKVYDRSCWIFNRQGILTRTPRWTLVWQKRWSRFRVEGKTTQTRIGETCYDPQSNLRLIWAYDRNHDWKLSWEIPIFHITAPDLHPTSVREITGIITASQWISKNERLLHTRR